MTSEEIRIAKFIGDATHNLKTLEEYKEKRDSAIWGILDTIASKKEKDQIFCRLHKKDYNMYCDLLKSKNLPKIHL